MTDIRETAARTDRSVDAYLAAMDEVTGWFFPPDTLLFSAIDGMQAERGVRGDILEIGVFRGRSAILLGYFPRDGERLVLCDLFEEIGEISAENEQERRYCAERDNLDFPPRAEFERCYLRWHPELPEVHQVPSGRLGELLPEGSFRLVHVDGGHTFDVVQQDVRTARRLLGPGGVVIFDDWSNGQQPGVALAIWQEYLRGELLPLAFTPTKFYATWDPAGITATDLQDWAAGQPDMVVTYPHLLDGRAASYLSMAPEYWQRLFPQHFA